jgi:hypothetical protein
LNHYLNKLLIIGLKKKLPILQLLHGENEDAHENHDGSTLEALPTGPGHLGEQLVVTFPDIGSDLFHWV